MSQTIVLTKLQKPLVRSPSIDRSYLVDQSIGDPRCRILLVTGPAGYGKTSLVSGVLDQVKDPFVWVSLDPEDDDPSLFFNLMMVGIHQQIDGFEIVPFPQRTDLTLMLTSLRGFVNSLNRFGESLTIVLDDYHLIQDELIHTGMGYLIEHLPANLRFVLLSRSSPPFPLPRWRARGWLAEITQADLRFKLPAAIQFMHSTMGIQLDDPTIKGIWERVDGWVTGLQFAALLFQRGRGEIDLERVDAYSADYLLSEVLGQESQDLQTFLLRTSILDRLSGSLCNALLEIETAQSRLESMVSRNLFTSPLDHYREWFRYHPVMRDLLRSQLAQTYTQADIEALHVRAARWFAQAGMREEGIQHALLAHDYPLAAEMIAAIPTRAIWEEEGVHTLTRWYAALPEDYLYDYPKIGILYCGTALVQGEAHRAIPILDRLEGIEAIRGAWHLLHGIILRNSQRLHEALHHFEIAEKTLPPDDINIVMINYLQLAISHREMGQMRLGNRYIQKGITYFNQSSEKPPNVGAQLSWFQGGMFLAQGKIEAAHAILQDGLKEIEAAPIHQRTTKGYLLTTLGEVYLLQYDLARSEDHALQGYELGQRTGIDDMVLNGLTCLTHIAVIQRDLPAVDRYLSALKEGFSRSRIPSMIDIADLFEVRCRLQLGELDIVKAWVAETGFAYDMPFDPKQRMIYLLWGQAVLALGQAGGTAWQHPLSLNQLLTFFERLFDLGVESDEFFLQLDTHLLMARVQTLMGESESARDHISQALDMGLASGGILSYFNYLPEIERYLAEAHAESAERVRLAKRLLALMATSQGVSSPSASMSIGLTGRELEMLQALAAGLSNKAIEAEMMISSNTVRTHLRNLYSKLDVTSRTQAVLKGQTLGLI